jgi:sugar phosphate isomerase/epimerase
MEKDPKGVLEQLAKDGYKQIESFSTGAERDVFWGMTAHDFKSYCDSLGLACISAHCDPEYTLNEKLSDEFRRLVDDAAGIGMKYLINPYMIQLKTIDDFRKAAEGFNKQGEICKEAGLKFGYHNHNYSFRKIGNVFPQDVMMQNTDPSLVDFEMDIYWVVDAGQDPIEWLKKYRNRFRLCHIKDHYPDDITKELVKKETPEEPELGLNVSCDLGKGKINFSKILKVASETGMKYYIVEQERFDQSTPLQSAKHDADYMRQLHIES